MPLRDEQPDHTGHHRPALTEFDLTGGAAAHPLLCGHQTDSARTNGAKLVCRTCRSFWDQNAKFRGEDYDGTYADRRAHFDPFVGALKARTFQLWLRKSGLDLTGLNVCEVGFGGGFCLQYIRNHAKGVVGIEASEDHLTHAATLGVERSNLFRFDQLPDSLGSKVDLWVFQDSFEHLPDPSSFMTWVLEQSTPGAAILLVAPEAASLSELALGRLWPHRLPDHLFCWSKQGLLQFFEQRDFFLERSFYPLKFVSAGMLYAHVANKFGFRSTQPHSRLAFLFNFGEMGVVLRRNAR